MEIQRLIGRSLRAVIDLGIIGERTITLDCDVLQADGGTRTASVTGAYVAVYQVALKLKDLIGLNELPLFDSVCAVSVGVVDGQVLLDLDYEEDSAAEVDMNVVHDRRRQAGRGAGHGRGRAVRAGDARRSMTGRWPPPAARRSGRRAGRGASRRWAEEAPCASCSPRGNRHKLGEFRGILAPLRGRADARRRRAAARGRRRRSPTTPRARRSRSPSCVVGDPAQAAVLEGTAPAGRDWRDDLSSSPTTPASRSRRWGGRRASPAPATPAWTGPAPTPPTSRASCAELAGFAGPAARRARFVCSVVAVTPRMADYAATGYWWGAIAEAPRGGGGFGYDPVFVPEGSDLTVAEWPQADKDQASHRALAGKALLERLRREGLLDGDGRA